MKGATYLLIFFLFLVPGLLLAQPGIAEMNQATGNLRQSFFSARDASLVLAGLFGITGAVKIYYNWQMGKDRISPEVAGWFFASLFMILAGPFLQALLGI